MIVALVLQILSACSSGPNPMYPEDAVCGSTLPPSTLPPASLTLQPMGAFSDACSVEEGVAMCGGSGPTTKEPVVHAVAAGRGACGLTAAGVAHCWFTDYGAAKPEGVFARLDMSPGAAVCGVRPDGKLSCFGREAPLQVPEGTYVDVGVGRDFACALGLTGEVACWRYGQDQNCETDPPKGPFARLQVDPNGRAICGVRSDGSAACWGARVPELPGSTWKDFAPTGGITAGVCGIGGDGTIACAGGRGLLPVPAGTYASLRAIKGGMCATPESGLPVCWGDLILTTSPPGAITIVVPKPPATGVVESMDGVFATFPSAPTFEESAETAVRRWSWTTTDPGPQLMAVEIVTPDPQIRGGGTEEMLRFAVQSKALAFGGGTVGSVRRLRLQERDGLAFYIEYPDGRAVKSYAYVDGERVILASAMSMRDDTKAWGRSIQLHESVTFAK